MNVECCWHRMAGSPYSCVIAIMSLSRSYDMSHVKLFVTIAVIAFGLVVWTTELVSL